MTKSVSELYKATEHINRGELHHRIQVRTNDQMAALEQSFNSMTQSLANLIAEQKEKQRMESELAIAHEVQALLFPADLSGLPSLEVHGVCQPARTVSGDYYDFIPLSEAAADAGGRRHQRQRNFGGAADGDGARVRPRLLAGAGEDAGLAGAGRGRLAKQRLIAVRRWQRRFRRDCLSPAFLMATLNYQLFRSTPPEKYATMFLGCYDAIVAAR